MKTSVSELAAAATRPQERLAFDPANLPIKGLLWHILIAPVRPRTKSEGGIEIPDEVQSAEAHLISIGKVLEVGEFAYRSKTPSGLDLAQAETKAKVGDFVLYDQHAGTRVVFRDGRTLVIITDTEIKAIVKPEEVANVRFYL